MHLKTFCKIIEIDGGTMLVRKDTTPDDVPAVSITVDLGHRYCVVYNQVPGQTIEEADSQMDVLLEAFTEETARSLINLLDKAQEKADARERIIVSAEYRPVATTKQ